MLNKTVSNMLKPLFTILVVFSCFPALKSQMSGSYTVDSSVSASSTNFKTWFSFWRSLQGQARNDGGSTLAGGISASISVLVKSNLTDTSQVKFPTVAGTSSTKTIAIDGNGKFIACAKTGEVISFQGADYITIKNLTVRNLGTSAANASCVRFYNNSDYNTIEKCTLEFSSISTGATDGSAYVVFCASATILSTISATLTGSNNIVKNNLCRTTNSNSPGPTFGMAINGNNSGYTSTAHNNLIDSNTIQNFYYIAFQASNGNGNQITRNTISRSNATSKNCNAVLYGFKINGNYASNREFKINSNVIQNLPFNGATTSASFTDFYGIYGTDNIGNKNYSFQIQGNTVKNIYASDITVMAYLNNSDFLEITNNTLDNIKGTNIQGTLKVWEITTGDEFVFTGNTVKNCSFVAKETYVVHIDGFTSTKNGYNVISDNTISSNEFYYYGYLISTSGGDLKIMRNRILNNIINGGNGGYLFGLYPQDFESAEIYNNLIAGNVGEDGACAIYAISFTGSGTNFECHQNTVYQDGSSISTGAYDNNGLILYPYYQTSVKVSGNVIYIKEGASGAVIGVENIASSAVKLFDNNSYYVKNMGSETWFAPGGSSASDFTSWAALGFAGSGENFVNPNFADISNNDFHSKQWLLQNNVVTSSVNPKDIDLKTRNTVRSDRGIYETAADIKAVSSTFSIGTNVCSGTSKKISFKIQNLFSDTVYDFFVSYTVNAANKISQKVSKKLAPNDTITIAFNTAIAFNKWGKSRIAVFVDVPDDITSNDSIIFNTTVVPAPGGRSFSASAKPTKAIFKGTDPFAISIVGEPIILNVNSPRGYTNTQYGSKWTNSVYALHKSGVAVSAANGTLSLTTPSGSTDNEISFKLLNNTYEDSSIKVCVKTTDLSNGCDTAICTNLYFKSLVVPKFSFPAKICGNDTAKFVNSSSVKSGGMRFHWDFGVIGSTTDTSNQSDPIFLFPSNGTYKVKLTCYTMPYGFITYDSATVSVSNKPKAKFTRTNECEGKAIQFTNQSTPSGAILDWDFGNGSKHVSAPNPTYMYLVAGVYTVKLIAKDNGCTDSTTLKVFQFEKPAPSFIKTKGTCDNETIEFTNQSTLSGGGIISSYWYFEGGNVIKTDDAAFKFSTGGNKTVKLVTKSEFGCLDSITKTIAIKLAPKVAFSADRFCSLSTTIFNNTTPPIAGFTSNYAWDFGDGTFGSAMSPTHTWSSLGPKYIALTVNVTNGCADKLTLNASVLVEPKAAFKHSGTICSGGNVLFENNTTWAQGDIEYLWNFGDGKNSTIGDPQHIYTASKTTTYFVYLIASIKGGCADSIAQSVTVNALPKTCSFIGTPDYAFGYYGMKLEPTDNAGTPGAESGISYSWNITTLGLSSNATPTVNFSADGSYSVNMCATTSSSPKCSCCTTQIVVMNRANLRNQKLQEIALYPNPNDGNFKLKFNQDFGKRIDISILSASGTIVKSFSTFNDGLIQLNAGDLADGIYVVSIVSESGKYNAFLEVRK